MVSSGRTIPGVTSPSREPRRAERGPANRTRHTLTLACSSADGQDISTQPTHIQTSTVAAGDCFWAWTGLMKARARYARLYLSCQARQGTCVEGSSYSESRNPICARGPARPPGHDALRVHSLSGVASPSQLACRTVCTTAPCAMYTRSGPYAPSQPRAELWKPLRCGSGEHSRAPYTRNTGAQGSHCQTQGSGSRLPHTGIAQPSRPT